MKQMNIETTIDLPLEQVWNLFIDPKSYPKYFKYIKKVFHNGKMKQDSIWFDLATVMYVPALVLHKVSVFKEEKTLQFYVPIPLVGKIVETIDLEKEGNKTHIKANVQYNYGPVVGFLFNKTFEKRFGEMVRDGIMLAKKDLERKD